VLGQALAVRDVGGGGGPIADAVAACAMAVQPDRGDKNPFRGSKSLLGQDHRQALADLAYRARRRGGRRRCRPTAGVERTVRLLTVTCWASRNAGVESVVDPTTEPLAGARLLCTASGETDALVASRGVRVG
jgi:hypothetical protein